MESESNYTRKRSITVEAEHVDERALNYNCVQGEIPGTTPETLTLPNDQTLTISEAGAPNLPSIEFISEVKEDARIQVISEANQTILEHVQTLIKQGKFLKICKSEMTEFNFNGSINTLPTETDLEQWEKLTNDKCFCGLRQTLTHVLNCCRICLDQGRYTYRHDYILWYTAKCLDITKYSC